MNEPFNLRAVIPSDDGPMSFDMGRGGPLLVDALGKAERLLREQLNMPAAILVFKGEHEFGRAEADADGNVKWFLTPAVWTGVLR